MGCCVQPSACDAIPVVGPCSRLLLPSRLQKGLLFSQNSRKLRGGQLELGRPDATNEGAVLFHCDIGIGVRQGGVDTPQILELEAVSERPFT